MKRYQKNILVSGTVTLNQLYNALRRLGVIPLIALTDMYEELQKKQAESMYLPVKVRGKQTALLFHFMPNYQFRSMYLSKLPSESRKLKTTQNSILVIQLGYLDLSENEVNHIPYELGGGYVNEYDPDNPKHDLFMEIKGN